MGSRTARCGRANERERWLDSADRGADPISQLIYRRLHVEVSQKGRVEMDGKQISQGQAIMNGIMASLHLIFYYAFALIIWGFALKRNWLWFGASGAVLGFLVSLFFVFPVIAGQRTEDRTREMMFATGAIWGNIAVVAGVVGIVVWIARAIFF